MPRFQAAGSGFEENGQAGCLKARQIDMTKLRELLAVDERRFKFDHAAAVGAGAGEVAFRTDKADAGRDQLFTDRIDRWVGDLGEQLLEVII